MKKRSDFYGVEFDWFASDADGFIALMSSAGYGPIPDSVFERLEEQARIEARLSSLIGSRMMTDDWDRMVWQLSASGVFVYDWKHWDGPYQRLGIPPYPQRFDDLGFSPELRDALVVVPERFCTSVELRPDLLLPCTS